MGLCGKLSKSFFWSKFAPLDRVTYTLDKSYPLFEQLGPAQSLFTYNNFRETGLKCLLISKSTCNAKRSSHLNKVSLSGGLTSVVSQKHDYLFNNFISFICIRHVGRVNRQQISSSCGTKCSPVFHVFLRFFPKDYVIQYIGSLFWCNN